ncbi:polyhydroxyalkanoate synthesis repressor PhaR [Phreatobacter aquaticus]|uniref:Polyhydroxyalkanoate synthesis repressor PhaR n=1 Tax=Phreatobacter aquaticus TaxID=2570229 RepID=A0A4D7QGI1_9HYPH|nr:polyhydroxyalkanoate synthesis repressor PhaR [Phreatobacter aquaticus]QCK84949.1 polyhydroxyalkanoate synthesis repressor PhaR [Phreatobacter aquaticus]
MAKSDPVTIKKYANRRLYNTGTSTYVTLEDLAAMVKVGDDFLVYDAKTGDDITRSVLTQIIFEQEGKEGQNMLPVAFLRQLIRFYGDSMQLLVPRYLEMSIDSLTKEQDKFRGQIGNALGLNPLVAPFEQQIRRNMEMFERAFSVFSPFGKHADGTSVSSPDLEPVTPAAKAPAAEPAKEGDIDELKNQLADIQRKLEGLSRK